MRKYTLAIICTLLLGGTVLVSFAVAQDYQRSYSIASDGIIRIWSISGDVRIVGYDGANVVVEGFKVGRDRDRVEILDTSGPNRIDVGVRYPQNCNCDASVNFEVRVPRSGSFNFERIQSVSGNVTLSEVTGHIKAESTSGNVEVKSVSGLVSASSISGNVDVYLKKIEGTGNMKFASVSGNVTVKAPATLDALVEMVTISGSIRTDFGLEILERRYGPGGSARGRVGSGSCNISIRSVSGRVSLTK